MSDGKRFVPEVPHRHVTDPEVLRALAHPLRWRLYEALWHKDTATATELAELVGDTQANCSWHLRQLHRFGFIEPDETAKGRRRPWRVVRQTTNFDLSHAGEDSAEGVAATALSDVLLDRELAALRYRQATFRDDDPAWDEASMKSQTTGWLTAEELGALSAEIRDVFRRHIYDRLDRVEPDKRPEGCRPIRAVAWAIPATNSDD